MGVLQGPGSADLDLYLHKWNGATGVSVAASESSTSTENIVYNGTSGYYLWEVYSFRGSGAYTFRMQRP